MKFLDIYLEYYLLHGIIVLAFSKDMSTKNLSSNLSDLLSFRINPLEVDFDRLYAIMMYPLANFSSTPPILSYQEEIELLEIALSVLTHTQILPGAITLDPRQKDMLVATGFY